MGKIGFKKVSGIITLILGLLVFISLFIFLYKKGHPKDVLYEEIEVLSGNIESSTVATGKVSPRDEVLIKPQISGIIISLSKKAGDKVYAGEIIAKIQVVPESASLSSAESELNTANINLHYITAEYERQKELFEKKVIAKEALEKSESDYQKSVESVSRAKDNLDIIKTGISRKTAKYSNTQIKSTIDGTILDIPVKVGNSVIQTNNFNEGTTIAAVANMSDMVFMGKVDETEVGKIHTGMPISLSIGALDDRKFDAVLEYVSPKGVEENGAILFEIKAAVNVQDTTFLRAGYSANARIILEEAMNVLKIPEGCISISNDSAFVEVLTESGSKQVFEKKYVTTGLSDGIYIEVKSGLEQGQKVKGREIDPKSTDLKKDDQSDK